MRPLRFNVNTKEGLNEYHLGATNAKWLEKTISINRQELYQTFFDNYENGESQFHKLFYNLAYNNCTHQENIFIYEKLIWDLIKDENIFVIINYRTASFLMGNDLPFDKICWEYEIEYRANIEHTETIFIDKGFVPARTGWIKPPSSRWDNGDEDKTAVFEVNNFETFINVIFACCLDDCGSLNIFCLNKDKKRQFVSTLQGVKKPSLISILEKEDLFITLFLGADEGYQDYILIKSKDELSSKLGEIVDKINDAGQLYENKLEAVKTFDAFTGLIEESFGLKMHS